MPEPITRRGYNRQSFAWFLNVRETTWKLTAFIASGLFRMNGCRFLVILGGITICTSYIAAAFSSPSVLTIVLFTDVGTGFGMSLMW